MTGSLLVLADCYTCGRLMGFCPECVVSAPVDPHTDLPPDIGPDHLPRIPDPAAVARSVRRPICDQCVTVANTYRASGDRVKTEKERHAHHMEHV